ncbi:MAG: hypothetical protein ACM3IJ_05665 [Candidatus Levyibacteriota bacterium]
MNPTEAVQKPASNISVSMPKGPEPLVKMPEKKGGFFSKLGKSLGIEAVPVTPTAKPEQPQNFSIDPTAKPLVPKGIEDSLSGVNLDPAKAEPIEEAPEPASSLFGTEAANPVQDISGGVVQASPDASVNPTMAQDSTPAPDISGGVSSATDNDGSAAGSPETKPAGSGVSMPEVPVSAPVEALGSVPPSPAPAPAEALDNAPEPPVAVPGVPEAAPAASLADAPAVPVATDALPGAANLVATAENPEHKDPTSTHPSSANSVVEEKPGTTPDGFYEAMRKAGDEAAKVEEHTEAAAGAPAHPINDMPEAQVISEETLEAQSEGGEKLKELKTAEENAAKLNDAALGVKDDAANIDGSLGPKEEKTLFDQDGDGASEGLPGVFGAPAASEVKPAEMGIVGVKTPAAPASIPEEAARKVRQSHYNEVYNTDPLAFTKFDANGDPSVDIEELDRVTEEMFGNKPIHIGDVVKAHPKFAQQLKDMGINLQDELQKAA